MDRKKLGQHLSSILAEKVDKADVLRLALDGHLQLSVNFLDHINVLHTINGTCDWKKNESGMPVRLALHLLSSYYGNAFKFSNTVDSGEKGICDLLLIGNGRFIIEKNYYSLTNGPNVSLRSTQGIFLKRTKGPIMALMEEKASILFAHEKLADYKMPEDLPDNSLIVVRTKALLDAQEHLVYNELSKDKQLDQRAERTYLNIIGALLEIVTGTFKDESFSSETQLREFIAKKFDDLRGVKPTTLAKKFALAKKALDGELD